MAFFLSQLLQNYSVWATFPMRNFWKKTAADFCSPTAIPNSQPITGKK